MTAPQSSERAVLPRRDLSVLASGAGITLVGRVLGRSLHVLGQLIIGRGLGPTQFGLFSVGWTILNTVGLLSPLGLDKGVIRFGTQDMERDDSKIKGLLIESLLLAILAGTVLGGGLFLAAPWLAEEIFKKPGLVTVFRWFAVCFPLMAGLRVAAAGSRITKKMVYSVLSEGFVQPTVGVALVALFLFLGWGVRGAILAMALSFLFSFTLALYYLFRLFRSAWISDAKPSFKGRALILFSLPASFAGILTNITNRIDRFFVALFQPADAVGIYQAASQTSVLFGILLSSFTAIVLPMASGYHGTGDKRALEGLFKVSTRWAIYLSLPLFVVMVLTPVHVVVGLYGPGYEGGAAPLVVLAASSLVKAGTGPVGPMLIMTGHQNQWARISGIVILINIALNLVLIPRFGLMGAAVASLLGVVVLFSWGLLEVKRSLRIWPYENGLFRGLLAGGISGVGIFFIRDVVQVSAWGLCALTLFSGTLFVLCILMIGLDQEDSEIIAQILLRVRGRP